MIIVKTNMTEIPNSCKECQFSIKGYGNTMCPILHNWLEPFEIENGNTKLNNCPLEQICQTH